MSDEVLVAVIVATPPTLTALAAIYIALRSDRKITNLHVDVDGRLTQLLATTKAEAEAVGEIRGQRIERERHSSAS